MVLRFPGGKMFEFRKADNDANIMEDIYRLRYKVYCDEWGFEEPEDHPHGIETDEYDNHSVHFAAFREDDGSLIGTVRLIQSSDLGLPMLKHCALDIDTSLFDNSIVGEISRLAISKELRRRGPDRALYDDGVRELEEENIPISVKERRKNENAIVLGLYRCLYKESLDKGITHWYAVMARGLYLLLKKISIIPRQIGPEVNYHGLRAPYLLDLVQIMDYLKEKNPCLYHHFKD